MSCMAIVDDLGDQVMAVGANLSNVAASTVASMRLAQQQAQRVADDVNLTPAGQGNVGSAVMAAQALVIPAGQINGPDSASAKRNVDTDTTRHVAETGGAQASTAAAALRAVVAPNAGHETGANSRDDGRYTGDSLPTEMIVALRAGSSGQPAASEASRAHDSLTEASDQAAAFVERNPVVFESPAGAPEVDVDSSSSRNE